MLTTSSGNEVPIETIVSPITNSDILNFLAILLDDSTSISAPFISKIKPNIINKKLSIFSPITLFIFSKIYSYIHLLNSIYICDI